MPSPECAARTFFALGLSQAQTQRAMWTTPVVDGQAPPAERDFGVIPSRKSQRTANLMSIHASRGAVPPLNGGGIGCGVTQLLQDTLDATLGAMRVADIDFYHALPFAPLDDLHMRQRARDTVAHVGKAPATALPTGTIGLPKNRWEQADITGFTVGEQYQMLTIGKALG